MKAESDFQVYAATARSGKDHRRPFATARAASPREMHNARGLIMAVSMSAACWAAIALALLL